jgi:hypothetical protein
MNISNRAELNELKRELNSIEFDNKVLLRNRKDTYVFANDPKELKSWQDRLDADAVSLENRLKLVELRLTVRKIEIDDEKKKFLFWKL